jgi:hypothetical protein
MVRLIRSDRRSVEVDEAALAQARRILAEVLWKESRYVTPRLFEAIVRNGDLWDLDWGQRGPWFHAPGVLRWFQAPSFPVIITEASSK